MNRRLLCLAQFTLVALVWTGVSCKSLGPKTEGAAGKSPAFGGPQDVRRAEALWDKEMRDYKNWQPYPGLEGWQPGKSPHGKILKYHINSVAARSPRNPGNGAVIVKENYGERNGPLMAVTVMQKIRGYDPEDGDWFWVKFAPNGQIMTNPKGMKLAGRVAKGMSKGCIACHSNAAGGDFLFINDE